MRIIVFAIAMFLVSNVWAGAAACQTLKCVRKNIDSIDTQIVTLIGKRLMYGNYSPVTYKFHQLMPFE